MCVNDSYRSVDGVEVVKVDEFKHLRSNTRGTAIKRGEVKGAVRVECQE